MILVSVKNAYKMLVFENISEKKVFVKRCFEKREQAINSILPLLKELSCYFPPPLDSAILPLVSRNPYHWM